LVRELTVMDAHNLSFADATWFRRAMPESAAA
jgi:hypothetical protein